MLFCKCFKFYFINVLNVISKYIFVMLYCTIHCVVHIVQYLSMYPLKFFLASPCWLWITFYTKICYLTQNRTILFSIVTVGSSEIIINDAISCQRAIFLFFLFIIKKPAVLGFDFFFDQKKKANRFGRHLKNEAPIWFRHVKMDLNWPYIDKIRKVYFSKYKMTI